MNGCIYVDGHCHDQCKKLIHQAITGVPIHLYNRADTIFDCQDKCKALRGVGAGNSERCVAYTWTNGVCTLWSEIETTYDQHASISGLCQETSRPTVNFIPVVFFLILFVFLLQFSDPLPSKLKTPLLQNKHGTLAQHFCSCVVGHSCNQQKYHA